MMVRILIGIILGGAIGAILGYKGRCATGTCPLTSNPYIGGVYGALLGALLSSAFGSFTSGSVTEGDEKAAGIVFVTEKPALDKLIAEAQTPVLVDVFATWCPPCKALAPKLLAIKKEYGARLEIVKVDGDQARELVDTLGVQGYPTMIIYHDGHETARLVGNQEKAAILKALSLETTG